MSRKTQEHRQQVLDEIMSIVREGIMKQWEMLPLYERSEKDKEGVTIRESIRGFGVVTLIWTPDKTGGRELCDMRVC